MSEKDTHRVQFVADSGLVAQADAVAEILDLTRTDLIKRALHTYLTEKGADDQFKRRAQEAFIDGRVDEETLRQALGTEALVKTKQLQAAFETLGEGVPDPDDVPDIPTDEDFYGDRDEETVIDLEEGSQLVVRSPDSGEDDQDAVETDPS